MRGGGGGAWALAVVCGVAWRGGAGGFAAAGVVRVSGVGATGEIGRTWTRGGRTGGMSWNFF